jgi:phage/plasmid-like protein (TIGR03299 family)
MTAYVETMAYAGDTPWHGLGTAVDNNLSTDEMLVTASLNWTVSKRKLLASSGELNLPSELTPVPGFFALTRDSDDHVLSVVGNNYKPVQNAEAMDFFKKFVDAGQMQMETAGSLKHGQYIWGLAKINKSFQIGHEDVVDGYLLLSSPHIFGMSMVFQFTPVRVVCWNTLNMALGSNLKGKPGSYRVPHSRLFNANVKAAAKLALGLANNQMDEFAEAAKHLSTKYVKQDDLQSYFYQVADLNQPDVSEANDNHKDPKVVRLFQEALENAPGQQLDTTAGTWWGAVNAVTHVVDHGMGRTRDNGLTSAWFGWGSMMKRKALHLALKAAA